MRVANNSALGRPKPIYSSPLALCCISLVYELRNLNQDSLLLPFTFKQGLATLRVDWSVSFEVRKTGEYYITTV
jgi:hypothetical protein